LRKDSDWTLQAVEREEKAVEESEKAAVTSHLPATHALVIPIETLSEHGRRNFGFENARDVEPNAFFHSHHREARVDILGDKVETVVVADEVNHGLPFAEPTSTMWKQSTTANFFFGELRQPGHPIFTILPRHHAEAHFTSRVGGFEWKADALHDIVDFVDRGSKRGRNANVVINSHDELVMFGRNSANELSVIFAADRTPYIVNIFVLTVDELAECVVFRMHRARVIDDKDVARPEVRVG
jgi:hypothetical protein